MQKTIRYVIFGTRWGYFGLAGTESVLCRTHLPEPKSEKIKSRLLKNLADAHFDGNFFKTLQQQIAAYFEGGRLNFSPDILVDLSNLSPFCCAVLTACRGIEFGQTMSYAGLAKRSGRPAACRAVGGALAKNPLPLIIPCHRIVRSDGKIGGFSAPGGVKLKRNMLELERQALTA